MGSNCQDSGSVKECVLTRHRPVWIWGCGSTCAFTDSEMSGFRVVKACVLSRARNVGIEGCESMRAVAGPKCKDSGLWKQACCRGSEVSVSRVGERLRADAAPKNVWIWGCERARAFADSEMSRFRVVKARVLSRARNVGI